MYTVCRNGSQESARSLLIKVFKPYFSGVGGQNVVFQYRAEVGLLTRNVVVRGNEDAQWDRVIEGCEDGFNPGIYMCGYLVHTHLSTP